MSNLVSNIIPLVVTGGGGGDGDSGTALTSPTFTYSSGLLSLVTYSGGHTKTLSYNANGTLNTVVSVIDSVATTKTFTYNADGTLASIS